MYKFRSMRLDTPHDTPTHLLENPGQYILKVGGFIRKTSIDELPQLLNILKGDMSVIGPRHALWSQDDLIAERDRYGANDIRPGLTGLAQISGRDELEIDVKVRLDGEYTEALNGGCGFKMDLKCFFGTVKSVLRSDGVVEGGTGEIKKAEEEMKILVICQYYYPEPFRISDTCEALVRQGHSVTVVTGTPNYPMGEIYPGYENG